MFHGLASVLAGMSLAEELHTVGFTIFVVLGSVCCFIGREGPRRNQRDARSTALNQAQPLPHHIGPSTAWRSRATAMR